MFTETKISIQTAFITVQVETLINKKTMQEVHGITRNNFHDTLKLNRKKSGNRDYTVLIGNDQKLGIFVD